jgi:hypothetical protein
MTGILATCLIRNKLGVINRHQSTFNDHIWHLMAILATGLHQSTTTFIILKEMARKTYIIIHIEMFIAFKVTVACTARDCYSVNYLCDMIFMSEFNTIVIDLF